MVTLASTEKRPRDERVRSGAGTTDNPLTDIQVEDLSSQGINEGDIVPGKGRLTPTGTFEPTTVSDANIRETIIPELNSRINKFSETGRYYDQQGNLRESDGEIVEENTEDSRQTQIDQIEGEMESDEDTTKRQLNDLARDTDRQTRRMVRAVQRQFDVREAQLEDINRRNEAATDTMLLLGGAARYSASSSGISAAQERAGVMALAELDAEEQALISEIKTAQEEKEYERADTILERASKLREKKIEEAKKLAEALAEENNKLREKQLQATREVAVAEIFGAGITDPREIQDYLYNTEGGDFAKSITLEEIQDTLDIINPPESLSGMTADYKTYKALKEAGEINQNWNYLDYIAALGNAKRAPKSGGGGGDDDDTDEYTLAEQYVQENAHLTAEQLKSDLLRDSDLSVSEINAIIANKKPELAIDEDLAEKIVIAARKKASKFFTSGEDENNAVKRTFNKGELTVGGEKYKLTGEQIELLNKKLEEMGERTTTERVLPGGR